MVDEVIHDWAYWKDKRCCVCGEPAEMAVRDCHEIPPPAGDKWRHVRPGQTSYYCFAHKRPALTFLLDGSIASH